MKVNNITDRQMQAAPGESDEWLSKSLGRGCGIFEARITPTGGRYFYFRYVGPTGTSTRIRIGMYSPKGDRGGMTVAQAAKVAAEWSLLYQRGTRDLRAHFDQEREAKAAANALALEQIEAKRQALVEAEAASARRITVRKLFERWAKTDLQPHQGADGKRRGRKDGGQFTREQFERRVFPAIGDMAVADVRKSDTMAILDAAKAEGLLRTANVLLADMKQMFRFAQVREIIERSPLDLVTKRDVGGTEGPRTRVLAPDEIKSLVKAIPAARLAKRSETAIWLILSTACRISEAMGARWEHIDLPKAVWYLPETKNERDHTIHLSAFAIEQFEALLALRPKDKNGSDVAWVFPNIALDGALDIKTFGKQLADRQREPSRKMSGRSKNTEALALPGGRWTAHDLRRTAATLMASLGTSGDVIDECLNHVIESRVRRTYITDRRLPDQARAFDVLGARLTELTSGN